MMFKVCVAAGILQNDFSYLNIYHLWSLSVSSWAHITHRYFNLNKADVRDRTMSNI